MKNIDKLLSWIKKFQLLIVIILISSIIFVIIRLWDQIKSIKWNFNIIGLIFSIVLVVASIIAWAFYWSRMLQKLDRKHPSIIQGMNIYLYGNLAKYLPGSIWNYVARGYLGRQKGMKLTPIGVVTLIEIFCSIGVCLSIYWISIQFPSADQQSIYETPVIFLAIICLVIASPLVSNWLDVITHKYLIKKEYKIFSNEISYKWGAYFYFVVILYIISIIIGVGFFLLLFSLKPIPLEFLPKAIGIWLLSAVAGLLAVGIPQGIGIKEGILVLVLRTWFSLPEAVSIAVITRLWYIVCDLLSIFIWWITQKFLYPILLKKNTVIKV